MYFLSFPGNAGIFEQQSLTQFDPILCCILVNQQNILGVTSEYQVGIQTFIQLSTSNSSEI